MKYRFIADLFSPDLFQWGLRGDPFLWEELRKALVDAPLPQSEGALIDTIEATFQTLTKHQLPHEAAVTDDDSIYVERYLRGGMSSGHVSLSFWRKTALPELLSRYASRVTGRG